MFHSSLAYTSMNTSLGGLRGSLKTVLLRDRDSKSRTQLWAELA